MALMSVSGSAHSTAVSREEQNMNIEQTLQRLQDRVDINELMARYCRYADQLDAEGMAACFTDDCIVAYVPASMAAPARSKKELLGFLHAYFPSSVSSSHYITNVELLFDKPDQVTAHTYMYSWQRFKDYPAAADCHRYGRYEFRVARTAEGWRFARLTLLSAGEYGGARIAEQFNRPWPPNFE
jgi:SnoaL-like domain